MIRQGSLDVAHTAYKPYGPTMYMVVAYQVGSVGAPNAWSQASIPSTRKSRKPAKNMVVVPAVSGTS